MKRSALLSIVCVSAIAITASSAQAGGIQFSVGGSRVSLGNQGFRVQPPKKRLPAPPVRPLPSPKPICKKPIHPPIIKPVCPPKRPIVRPICPPVVKPPVRPVCPPVIKPPVRPVCPPVVQPPVCPPHRPVLPTLGFEGDISRYGMFIQAVVPGDVADQIGLIAGDTILSINRRPVTSRPSWQNALERADGEVSLRVRMGETGEIVEYYIFVLEGIAYAQPPQYELYEEVAQNNRF